METDIFKPIELEDRETIISYTYAHGSKICDLAFSNLYGWRERYETAWAILEDSLVIRFRSTGYGHHAYLTPICYCLERGRRVLQYLYEVCQRAGHPLVIMGITPHCRERIEEMWPGAFRFVSDEGSRDYIYLRERLVTLSGKKLQPKRNHINKFERLYPDWSYEEVAESNMAECLAIGEAWLSSREANQGRLDERRMIERIITHMDALGLRGGALRVEGRIVAFSLGSPINQDTYGVHVEKALTEYDGAFPMMNREYARRIPESYTYVNREEDLGLEGLRKSKLSYYPDIILSKDVAILNHEPNW